MFRNVKNWSKKYYTNTNVEVSSDGFFYIDFSSIKESIPYVSC